MGGPATGGPAALLRQCPLLLPQNRERTAYEGFVSAQGRDFHIRILLPTDFQLKNAKLECSWQLKKILNQYQHILKQRLHSCPDLSSFMVELKTLLEIALKNTQDLHIPRPPEYYSCLVRDLEILGWNKVAYMDTGLTTIKLKAEDSCGRQHLITLKFNAKYPKEPPDCLVDFPVPFAVSWMPQVLILAAGSLLQNRTRDQRLVLCAHGNALVVWSFGEIDLFSVGDTDLELLDQNGGASEANAKNGGGCGGFRKVSGCCVSGIVKLLLVRKKQLPNKSKGSAITQSSLLDIYNQFLAALESLKEFWDAMDEIDGKTWVLEPENPTRSATTRRIAIGNNISVSVEVDPRHPATLPECYFLGADHAVNPLRTKLNNNMHLWDPEISLLQNLKDLLEIDFPSRAALEKSDFAKDCGICYAYRLNGAAPDHVCDDPRCGQPFHQACLYEWLQGLPSSRHSFNVIFGECPYCNKGYLKTFFKPLTLKSSMKKL